MSSLRRKYMKGKHDESEEVVTKTGDEGKKGNSEEVSKEIITIKKETKITKGGDGNTSNDAEVSLKKISVEDLGNKEANSGGRFSKTKKTVEETSEGTKKVITKTEMKVESDNSTNPKGVKRSRFTKTTETTTTVTNQKGGNDKGKKDITTTTTKTTTTNTKNEGAGRSRSKGEVTTKTTTTTNQKSTGNQRNQPPSAGRRTKEETKTTTQTKKTTTTTSNQPGTRGKAVTTSQTNQVTRNTRNNNENNRNAPNKPTAANPRSLQNQKSTPALRGNNPIKPNKNLKDDKKRPLSSIQQSPDGRDNVSSISIKDTGKHPPKPYVLNVRVTERIQPTKKPPKLQNDDPSDITFNHNIKVVKNVTKELPTVEDLPKGAKIIHRYNFSYNPNIPNTSRVSIDETGKIPKKEVVVSPRKNIVLRVERKSPSNNNANPQPSKKIPLPPKDANKRGRNANNEPNKKTTNDNLRGAKNTTTTTKTETKTTRGRTEGKGNKTQETTTTTKTKVTETRTTRGKTDGGNPRGNAKETKTTKTTVTKTTETSTRNGSQLRGAKNSNDANTRNKSKADDKGSKRNKVEGVSKTELSVHESGGRGRSAGRETKESKTKDNSEKVSTRFKKSKDADGTSKEESKTTRVKKEGGKTTTTTVTETKVEKTSGGDGDDGSKVKKFRSFRMLKK